MAGKLNARRVETLMKPGRYSDGNNLYLFISPNGGKRWTYFYRLGKTVDGKEIRREMGLGGAARGQAAALHRRSGEKRFSGPPPQPSLPAVRHAIITLMMQTTPSRCPHCRRWLDIKPHD